MDVPPDIDLPSFLADPATHVLLPAWRDDAQIWEAAAFARARFGLHAPYVAAQLRDMPWRERLAVNAALNALRPGDPAYVTRADMRAIWPRFKGGAVAKRDLARALVEMPREWLPLLREQVSRGDGAGKARRKGKAKAKGKRGMSEARNRRRREKARAKKKLRKRASLQGRAEVVDEQVRGSADAAELSNTDNEAVFGSAGPTGVPQEISTSRASSGPRDFDGAEPKTPRRKRKSTPGEDRPVKRRCASPELDSRLQVKTFAEAQPPNGQDSDDESLVQSRASSVFDASDSGHVSQDCRSQGSPPTPMEYIAVDAEGLSLKRQESPSAETDFESSPTSGRGFEETTPQKTPRMPTKSPYFPKPSKTTIRSPSKTKTSPSKRRAGVSCLPFPPLSQQSFGLIQERTWSNPFHLLIAVMLLNKTTGKASIPVFYELTQRFSTPEHLAQASVEEVTTIIGRLGLQRRRAAHIVRLANTWLEHPPSSQKRYRTLHYPRKGDGCAIERGEIIGPEDNRSGAWEIGHLPGIGAYAFDSWRIFCRDALLGKASDWNGAGRDKHAEDCKFEPEWKRVLPHDKELRALLRWMWLKSGWVWNPITGTRSLASKDVLQAARDFGGLEETFEEDDPEGNLEDGISDNEGLSESPPTSKIEQGASEAQNGPPFVCDLCGRCYSRSRLWFEKHLARCKTS